MAWIVVIFSHFEKAILFYHLSGDSRISLWERDKRIEGCREQAHRYVLLIKHKMGESPRTWAWIMHVKVLGGAEVLKYWGEFVRKQGDEEVKRHWGLEKACCVESNHISLLMELARRTTLVLALLHTPVGFLQLLICHFLCIQTIAVWPWTECDTMGFTKTLDSTTQVQESERDTHTQ